MFDLKKKKKPLSYSDTPSAPKLGILSLPSESPRPTHAPLAYEREPTSIMKTPLPERRTMTPLISTNHSKSSRHESPSRDYAPRQRTVSTQEGVSSFISIVYHCTIPLLPAHTAAVIALFVLLLSFERLELTPLALFLFVIGHWCRQPH